MLPGMEKRAKYLRRSLPYALLPIILFFPVLIWLKIYGPSWSAAVAVAYAAGSVLSEAWAIRKLSRSIRWDFDGRFDLITAIAMGLLVISITAAALFLWLLLRTPPAV
jgi:hypothetical protein